LRIYYYRSWAPDAFARACQSTRIEAITNALRPEHDVLDIGSGIGNLALGLVDYLDGHYDGLEVHREAVTWCQQAITPAHPSFRFHVAEVRSEAYNPSGKVPPERYIFPFDAGSFDFVFLRIGVHAHAASGCRALLERDRKSAAAGWLVCG
jgi:SAM-dependent methyltransferase